MYMFIDMFVAHLCQLFCAYVLLSFRVVSGSYAVCVVFCILRNVFNIPFSVVCTYIHNYVCMYGCMYVCQFPLAAYYGKVARARMVKFSHKILNILNLKYS